MYKGGGVSYDFDVRESFNIVSNTDQKIRHRDIKSESGIKTRPSKNDQQETVSPPNVNELMDMDFENLFLSLSAMPLKSQIRILKEKLLQT